MKKTYRKPVIALMGVRIAACGKCGMATQCGKYVQNAYLA